MHVLIQCVSAVFIALFWSNLSLHGSNVITFFECPISPTHRTLLFVCVGGYPFDNAVHVKTMRTFSPNYRTSVARESAVCAATIKQVSTDTTRIIISNPMPCCNCCPSFDLYFHIQTRVLVIRNKIMKASRQVELSKNYTRYHFLR